MNNAPYQTINYCFSLPQNNRQSTTASFLLLIWRRLLDSCGDHRVIRPSSPHASAHCVTILDLLYCLKVANLIIPKMQALFYQEKVVVLQT
jgi:hypothetical protein